MKKVFTLVLVLMCVLLSFGTVLAEATVSSVGAGTVRAMPDCATLWLGVTQTDKDVETAQSRVNSRIAKVRKVLMKNGVAQEDVALGSLNIYTQYDYNGNESKVSGYVVTHQLEITVRDLDNIGALIDAALAAGANQVDSINFALENGDAAYAQALALAVESARAKAEIIAKAEGLTLDTVLSMTENSNDYIGPQYQMAKNGDAAGEATQIDVAGMSVGATVTVVYSTK